MPVSLITRNAARNCPRPPAGAASELIVMMMPLDMPLPTPMSSATAAIDETSRVSGSSRNARPRTAIDGTATQRRPKRSIALPAG